MCVAAGAPGITVHPRADARHITFARRARDIRRSCAPISGRRSSSTSRGIRAPTCWPWCTRSGPTSARSCRSRDGEITSQAGWPPSTPVSALQHDRPRSAARRHPRERVHRPGSRRPCGGRRRSTPIASSSTPSPTRARIAARRRERQESFERYAAAATLAHSLGARHQRRPRPRPRRTSRSSGRCRTSTRCRSATR